jgi:hypothetical protein
MINGAVISDIHLGHKRTPSIDIIRNLTRDFKDDKEFAKLDIIFINGDVFDDLLSLNHHELSEIEQWIVDFLRLCAKHRVLLRVLEGTPLHDWKQSYKFETLNILANTNADVRHIKTLYVEKIESLGINVLYVPDEWNDSANKTLEQARSLVKETGYDRVDTAIMHGNFQHHLPSHAKAQRHSNSEYQKLVAGPIFIGHNHGYSVEGGIITPGSYDRLSHNEEHKKGHVRFQYDPIKKKYKTRFVENVGAKVYKTITCVSANLDDALHEIDLGLDNVPANSHIRIVADINNPVLQNMDTLVRLFGQFRWTKKSISEEEQEDQKCDSDSETILTPITITKENIVDLLMDRMQGDLSDDEIPIARALIEDIVK